MPRKMMKNKRTGKGRRKKEDAGPRTRSRFLNGGADVDTKDHELLRQFVTEQGKIVPARLTGATARQQRQIKHGVRRARNIGLVP